MSAPVLVTGASGFLGARLVEALGDAGVPARGLGHRRAPPRCAEGMRGDLRDPALRRRAVRGASAVVHCAALLDPVPSEREADEVNHRATVALAREAAEAGCRAFLFVSSQAALGWQPRAGLQREDAPARPTTAYGRSKRAAERALLAMDLGRTRRCVLRPPTVYGPGERRNFLALARAAATGVFPVPGRGDNRMSFCHLDNAVEAIRFALSHPDATGVLHVADPRAPTLREVVDTIARAAGRRPFAVPFPLPAARLAARACELAFAPTPWPPPLSRGRLRTLTSDCALDVSRLAALGFRWPVTFEEGVRETVASYRREGAL
ncbi:MAG TPA: NAD-dependent epimerase/dehydratase family protein [Sandaracinaceae bacterium LLY-WYZ-13_1]|nr:NAD-dependent epimerase/dehydratase family protein [Sandaracinaceae bacterium LLY-WYZ-13_1]